MNKQNKKQKKADDENEIDINLALFSPQDLAQLLPPEEIAITKLTAEPYEDGRRVFVTVEISPFKKRPHLEFTLSDLENQIISSASFVEPMNWKMEFTMHLRTKPADGPLNLEARLFYPDGPQAEPVRLRFELPHRIGTQPLGQTQDKPDPVL